MKPIREDNTALEAYEMVTEQIELILPKETVMGAAKSFLESCGWSLEIDEKLVSIPKGTEIYIRSRAYVKADAEDVFLGDHYEAVVLIGKVSIGKHKRAEYGLLRMYFNLNGEFVSQDRYDKYS